MGSSQRCQPEDLFIGQCLWRFPNIYRKWLRERRRYSNVVFSDEVALFERTASPSPSAHDVPMQRAAITEVSSMLNVETARKAALMVSPDISGQERR